MLTALQWVLLALAVSLRLLGVSIGDGGRVLHLAHRIAERRRLAMAIVGFASFTGCALVVALTQEPAPVIHDEFSYLLMSNTFATGHVATPAPPLVEFFDTFHVLINPVYASKYFPAQGLFLAAGEFVTGHPIVGVWLGAALASAATCWMLQAWISPLGGLIGGLLMVAQWSVFSYWGQSYWGGMVAALGGALVLGAARRLSVYPDWRTACCFGVGTAILSASRPAEGLAVTLSVSGMLAWEWWARRDVTTRATSRVVLPVVLILIATAAALGTYNRAVTGSVFTPPYVLHEAQYQESPQFTLLPMKPKITYSSPWLERFYSGFEQRLYDSQQGVRNRLNSSASTLLEWWQFYLGVFLSAPLVIIALLRGGVFAQTEQALLTGFAMVALLPGLLFLLPMLSAAQAVLLWLAVRDRWFRLALATTLLLLLESFVVKWFQPHYFAPAASLVIFLEVFALRWIWRWQEPAAVAPAAISDYDAGGRFRWRPFVVAVPVCCTLLITLQVVGRATHRWADLPRRGAATFLLSESGWSVRRVELHRWLSDQPEPQLVFVRYSPNHNVIFEWVFNHANVLDEHVVWARDLGDEHNRQLLALLPDRRVWLLEADAPTPGLTPYPSFESPAAMASLGQTSHSASKDRLPW